MNDSEKKDTYYEDEDKVLAVIKDFRDSIERHELRDWDRLTEVFICLRAIFEASYEEVK